MYYPHSVKKSVINGKTGKSENETERGVTNSLERDKIIKRFGQKKYDTDPALKRYRELYREPPIPTSYRWIYSHFMYMWSNCAYDFNGNIIFTFETVNEYEQFSGIRFSLVEKKLLLKMKKWACETIVAFDK